MNTSTSADPTCDAWYSANLRNDEAEIRRLIAAGVDVETDLYGTRALHNAASTGATPVIQALLDAGADPNARLAGGASPLHSAVTTGDLEHVNDLDRFDQDDWAKDPTNVWAQTIEALTNAGADLDAPNDQGWTPLHQAMFNGSAAAARALLEKGANPGPADTLGRTPKDLAIACGRFWLAGVLLNAEQQTLRDAVDRQAPPHESPSSPSLRRARL